MVHDVHIFKKRATLRGDSLILRHRLFPHIHYFFRQTKHKLFMFFRKNVYEEFCKNFILMAHMKQMSPDI